MITILLPLLFIEVEANCARSSVTKSSEIDEKVEGFLRKALDLKDLRGFSQKLIGGKLWEFDGQSQVLKPSSKLKNQILETAGVFDSTELSKSRNTLFEATQFSKPSEKPKNYLYIIKAIQLFYKRSFPGDKAYEPALGLDMDRALTRLMFPSFEQGLKENHEHYFSSRSFSVVTPEFNQSFRGMLSSLILKVPHELIISTSISDYGGMPKGIPYKSKPKIQKSQGPNVYSGRVNDMYRAIALKNQMDYPEYRDEAGILSPSEMVSVDPNRNRTRTNGVLTVANKHNEGKYFPGLNPNMETVEIVGLFISMRESEFLESLKKKKITFNLDENTSYSDNLLRAAIHYFWARKLGLPVVFFNN